MAAKKTSKGQKGQPVSIRNGKVHQGLQNISAESKAKDISDIQTKEGVLMTILWCLYVAYTGYNIFLESDSKFVLSLSFLMLRKFVFDFSINKT